MQQTYQTDTQSVLEHCISVKDYFHKLLEILPGSHLPSDWKLPAWLFLYHKEILSHLLPINIIDEYLQFHDCGKTKCLIIDQNGQRHFPNHAEFSYHTWLSVGGNYQAAQLMKMDMEIHQLKATDIDQFIKQPEAITLLLAGFSELHSNSQLFGGINSQSFKIKYKHLDRRGKIIVQKMFNNQGETNVID